MTKSKIPAWKILLSVLSLLCVMLGAMWTLGTGAVLVDKNPWWSLFGLPLMLVGFLGAELWRWVDKPTCRVCHPEKKSSAPSQSIEGEGKK